MAALATTLLLTLSFGFLAVVLLWRRAEAQRTHAEHEQILAERERSNSERERSRAEEARIRAEADYKVARAALAEVLNMGTRALEINDESRDFIACLQAARSGMLEIAKARSDDPEIWKLLAIVDLVLGRDHAHQGKALEVRPLLVESLLYWEKILQDDPHDRFAQQHRTESLLRLARVVERQGNIEDSVSHWERAVASVESIFPNVSDVELSALVECRISLARLVDRLGDHERAETILETSLRMLSEMRSKTMNPEASKWMLWTRTELGRLYERFSPRELEGLAAEDWAQRVTALLCSSPGTESMDPRQEFEIVHRLIEPFEVRAASQCHAGKLEEARRTADRLHALAQILVRRYPDKPAAHLSLSKAFQQKVKNAWRLEDRAAIERNLKLALAEARQALFLDPQNVQVRQEVSVLKQRLNDLLAPQKEREAPVVVCDKTGRE